MKLLIAIVLSLFLVGVFGECATNDVPLMTGGPSSRIDLGSVSLLSSTVPSNGDVNPYGVFIVPTSVGNLRQGSILVSNFNNATNLQGTGSTIVQITNGVMSLFANIPPNLSGCGSGVGLTTGLVVLQRGWVIVGSLPTTDGTSKTAQAGCLIVLDSNGSVKETIHGGPINGPWDAAVLDLGASALLFFTNVLNGGVAMLNQTLVNQGTVVRLNLQIPLSGSGALPMVASSTIIGSGFATRSDPAALILGPTGLALGADMTTLFVADTLFNRIAAIPNATCRNTTAYAGADVSANGLINMPLGMTLNRNGNLFIANGGDGNIVEVSPSGAQLGFILADTNGAGSLFGLDASRAANVVYFVSDAANTLNRLTY